MSVVALFPPPIFFCFLKKTKHFPSPQDPNLREEDNKTALHKAAWNCDHVLMQMLLEAGADTQAMDINGCAPIQYVLKVTGVRPMAVPERCYQLLLNHNAARIYPPQFHKVQRRTPYDFGSHFRLQTKCRVLFGAGAAGVLRLPCGGGNNGQLL